jgi:hypothetical protein
MARIIATNAVALLVIIREVSLVHVDEKKKHKPNFSRQFCQELETEKQPFKLRPAGAGADNWTAGRREQSLRS